MSEWLFVYHEPPRLPDLVCSMRVSGPALSDDYAFMSYSNPGGEIGAYAFSKSGDDWTVVEKVRLGFW